MTGRTERWSTVERLYHAPLARPVDERAAFVAEACAGDEEFRTRLSRSLRRLFVANLFKTTSNIWIGSLARP